MTCITFPWLMTTPPGRNTLRPGRLGNSAIALLNFQGARSLLPFGFVAQRDDSAL